MTRETIENLVIENTGRSDKLSLIRSAINLALDEISKARLWYDLQTEDEVSTTADTGSVSLAADVSRLSEVRLIDGNNSIKLSIRPKSWIVERWPAIEERDHARPAYGYLEGTTLHLIPIPDQVYTIRYTYFKLHPDLSASTDEVIIRGAAPLVVAYATFWVFKALEKTTDSESWYMTYEKLLASAKKHDASNSAIKSIVDIRGEPPTDIGEYWLDPFVKRNP